MKRGPLKPVRGDSAIGYSMWKDCQQRMAPPSDLDLHKRIMEWMSQVICPYEKTLHRRTCFQTPKRKQVEVTNRIMKWGEPCEYFDFSDAAKNHSHSDRMTGGAEPNCKYTRTEVHRRVDCPNQSFQFSFEKKTSKYRRPFDHLKDNASSSRTSSREQNSFTVQQFRYFLEH